MANKKNQAPAKDEFIKNIRKDTKAANRISLVSGYVGDSSEENHLRLYFDEELNNFIDVNCDDIVHSQKRPTDAFPLGGSFIWVKSTAVYTYGNPAVHNRPKASFLEGEIMAAYNGGKYGYTPNPFDDNPIVTTTVTTGPITTLATAHGTVLAASHKPTCDPIQCPPQVSKGYQLCVINTVNNCFEAVLPRKSAVDACPSALYCPTDRINPTIYQNVNRYAAFNPSWVDGCRSAMIQCAPVTDFVIRRTLACPSRLDGCPSTPGGCIDDLVYKTTYVQQVNTAVVNTAAVNTNIYRGTFNPLG